MNISLICPLILAFAVPTNEIDMTGAAFANLGENPLVFSVMVSMMCLYLCLCIWARSADIKDELRVCDVLSDLSR